MLGITPATDERKPSAAKTSGGATMKLQPVKTVKLKMEDTHERQAVSLNEARKDAKTPGFSYEWYGSTNVGSVRDHNEDSYACDVMDGAGLFVVADGMGGHDAGEVASSIAAEAVRSAVRSGIGKGSNPLTIVKKSVREANRAVLAEGLARGSNMGTTLGVAVLKDGKAYIANVGDSRAYWIENGTIRQITEDHSLVAKLVSAGKLTKEEARNHPKSNLLYRTIGSEGDVKVDTFETDLAPGGCLLLCSDGLWGEVADEEIHHICKTSHSPVLAVLALIDAANRNGGKDNITAVVVKIQ
jgi:protein phosphatase